MRIRRLKTKVSETHKLRCNQERYLLAERASPYAFFIGIWVTLQGRLDATRLRAAALEALARHPAFRTTFPRTVDGDYSVAVRAAPDLLFETLKVPDLQEATVEAAAAPFMVKPDDFEHLRDLHRLLLLEGPGDQQVLVLAQHHAISDGRSVDLLLSEIGALYSGKTDLAPPASFYDYVAPGTQDEDSKAFWQDNFKDLDAVAQMHRALRTSVGANPTRMGDTLGQDASDALSAAASGLKPFSILAAGFASQIARQTGQQDVVFSIQSAGRYGLADVNVLGPLSNAVPVRIHVDPKETVQTLAARLTVQIRQCLQQEALGYHNIQQVSSVRPDFALNLYPDPEPVQFDGVTPGPRRFLKSESDYAVNLRWHRDAHGAYAADLYYDTSAIETHRAEAFLARALAITRQCALYPDHTIAQTLEQTSVLPSSDAAAQITAPPKRLFDVFAETVQQHGTKSALRFEGRSTSYLELLESVERLAGMLHAKGLREGMTAAFIAERTPDFVKTILACSRLGLSFCALDAGYPPERLCQQAELLAPQAVLLPPAHTDRLADLLKARDLNVLELTQDTDAPTAPMPAPPDPQDIAYYLFTSGTTGTPSLIGTRHAALIAFLGWQAATFDLRPGERTTLLSGLAHDPVLRDVFLPLSTGGVLTIPSEDILRDPRKLSAWLEAEHPDILHTTPPLGRTLWQTNAAGPQFFGARLIFWGGDILPGELVEATAQVNKDLVQVNAYGATETPQVMLWHRCTGQDEHLRAVPIGQPRAGIKVRINTFDGGVGSANEVGEIVIEMPDHVVRAKSGAGDLRAVGTVYHTGDLGYLRPDGEIQLVGRADDQISIRGYRVELNEVSSVLSSQEGIKQSVVLVDQDDLGGAALSGHVVVQEGSDLDPVLLRRRLAAVVPPYMVPAKLILHEAMPLLPNGKVDRAALRQHADAAEISSVGQTSQVTALSEPGEIIVANILKDIVGQPVNSSNLSFVDLGGDSLNAIQAMLRLERVIPELSEDWPNMTLAELGRQVQSDTAQTSQAQGGRLRQAFALTRAELPVIFRALAILAVVALHYSFGSLGGGATIVLFLLTGYSMARFQLPKVLSTHTVRPILIPLVQIAAITFPVVLMITAIKMLQGEPLKLAGMFFLTNFIDFSDPLAAAGHTIWLWFIAVYVQLMLAFALIFTVPSVRRIVSARPGQALVGAFLAAVAAKFAVLAIADMSLLTQGVPLLTHWNYLPTTHLPTILLGLVVFMSRAGHIDRVLCSALILGYAVATGLVFEKNRPEVFACVALAVLFIGHIRIPRGLYVAALAISQTSLYLYLFHQPLNSVLTLAGLALSPPLKLILAVLFSIVFARFWEKFINTFSRWKA